MRLLVISHTDHYYTADGNIAGWGPTVREIDAMTELFDEVTHIACLYKDRPAPPSAVEYASGRVQFVGIAPFGGTGIGNKLNILTSAPHNLRLVKEHLQQADVFHFRAPTSIGLYIIPYLERSGKKGWYKYAGNWAAGNMPLSYRLQRNMLLRQQAHKVTINGRWAGQPSHCISFENPCLYEEDTAAGAELLLRKRYSAPYTLCFAGRLDKEKGLYRILDAIKAHPQRSLFKELHIAGDGPERLNIESAAKDTGIPVLFHGALSRSKLFELYRRSHFLLLPSDSEGFPKVVAEAANFGCIPIVADVSSVGQYINAQNGFLWNVANGDFSSFFAHLNLPAEDALRSMAANAHAMATSFTYSHYIKRIKSEVLD